jgi:PIN domain nuclease of toxin-antitoxin system
MNLLLDTHVLLWWLNDSKMTQAAQQSISDPHNVVYVSAASVWEISIKQAIGKLELEADILEAIETEGFAELAITGAHGLKAGQLPPYHHDPFDRMLIAQAQSESMSVVTRDKRFPQYNLPIVAA